MNYGFSLRNMHVATFMMNLFELFVIQHGYKRIRLWAIGKGNLVAFYEKLGYKIENPKWTTMIKDIAEILQRDFISVSQFERYKLEQLRGLVQKLRNELLNEDIGSVKL
ncbi:MAG: hypothetical protein K2J20_04995 [Bacilli bacterium]|nr:hypothetical protein [Bacilli bacterium]